MFRSGNFDKLLEKTTSNLLMDPDWTSMLQICDLIRQNDVQPKTAFAALKKKLFSPNPHTAFFALLLLECMVKNCGTHVHEELSSRAFCDTLHELARTTAHENVRNKLLELIQVWTFAFRKNPKHGALKDIMNLMKNEGFKFPVHKESDAMFSTDTAPDWADGDVCHRCRVQFTILIRKHHCRACGQVFCNQCSMKTTTLPKFGIEKEVRVCDSCYEQINKPSAKMSDKQETELPPEYIGSSLAQQNQAPPRKSEDELREEEELNLALALSQSEAEAKEKMKLSNSIQNVVQKTSELHIERSPSPVEEPANPELARYLDRSYWESLNTHDSSDSLRPTSPSAPATAFVQNNETKIKAKENGVINTDLEEFILTLKSQVEIFINRMKSNSSRGRSIANDTSVQTLFMNITAMHSTLLTHIQQHDDSRLHYERLQDKLTQVKDARAALDALREEHREKLRREAEEADRQRQLQMAHKLEIMRKKKQEYLQYQRQLALQRIQEQEREMQMRQEQQKQHYLMGGPQFGNYIGSPVHVQQYPPNSAPPVSNYQGYHYGGPGMPIHSGQPPHTAPQLGNVGPHGSIPSGHVGGPGFPPMGSPMPQASSVPIGVPQAHQPPTTGSVSNLGNQAQMVQQFPQQVPNPQQMMNMNNQQLPQQPGMPPQQPGMPPQQSGMPPQQPGMLPQGMQQIPPQFQQRPGAPPASPQIQNQQNGELQTAELISFD